MATLYALSSLVLIAGFASLMVLAAISDIRHFVISNRLCLIVAGLALAFIAIQILSPVQTLLWGSVKLHLAATFSITLVVFAICAIFFAMGIMGGGDVKLLSAATLWTGPAWTLDFLFVTAIAGGFVTLGVLLFSQRKFRAAGHASQVVQASQIVKVSDPIMPGIKVPYGIGIAVGGLYTACYMAKASLALI